MDSAELREQKREFQRLLESRAWVRLATILQEQADSLQKGVIFVPLKSLDGALEMEYNKGRLAGILSVTAILETEMANLDTEIEIAEAKEESNGNGSDE